MRACLLTLGSAALVAGGIAVGIVLGADRLGEAIYGSPRLP